MKSNTIILTLIMGFILISITACKKDSGFGGIKCQGSSEARYYIGDSWSSISCSSLGMTQVSTISATGLVDGGGCHLSKGTEDEQIRYYYSGNSVCGSSCQSYCISTYGSSPYYASWDTSTKSVFSAKELKF